MLAASSEYRRGVGKLEQFVSPATTVCSVTVAFNVKTSARKSTLAAA